MVRADDLQQELSGTVKATIASAAHRNEMWLAWIRAIHLSIALLAVLAFRQWPHLVGPAFVPPAYPIAAAFWTLVSWGIVLAERVNGGYRTWIPWAATFVDLAMILTFRVLAVFAPGSALLVLAGSAIISTLMAMTGALRLKRRWVWLATALAAANLTLAALSAGLTPASTLFLVLLLFVVGLVALGMSDLTREAVANEVRRVVLQRFLPKRVIDAGDRASLRLLTEPRSLDATVLISDIRSFTAFAEQLPPADVLALLNKVQGTFAEIVKEHGGTVDKFMGDGMLAVFGAPDPTSDHAERAIAAAQSMLESVCRLNASGDIAPVRIGVGVHSGRVVTGCLGSGARLEFTVIGDTVNIASRLEAMTKEKGVAAIISNETVVRAERPLSHFESLGTVAIRGRVQPLDIHSLKEHVCTT
ncbi:MAG TPA: adenylate/guanylate cyclase domain-containing protein [Thermoanaerobaculia bacterium]|jgi:class 3 adenylate cyclase|nr:adenylate/guanylate cyclase domain-containing protein [Thermoanaerobaculia bacterium]